jgi:hypothetical protein
MSSAGAPANFGESVSIRADQTITGSKTFSGSTTLSGSVTAPSATTGARAPAFTGTAPTTAAASLVTGTGFATAGQVVTTTSNFTATASQYANCWLITATHAPCLIVSHPAVTGAPLALTVFGLAPTTAAEAFRILIGPTPAGSVASHTHVGLT